MPEIEYFYSAQSGFAYIGAARFMEIARAAGRRIAHRPMDLRRVVAEAGAGPFGKRSLAHANYFFNREIERWSEFRGVETVGRIPTHHHRDPGLANRMLIAAAARGLDVDRLAHTMMQALWRDDTNLADPESLAAIGRAAGVDPAPLLAAAETAAVQEAYAANTEEAIRRSVFGSPTYVVDGDMFYGQDHLEMVERALEKPFAARWEKFGAR